MRVSDVMTRDVVVVRPGDTIRRAAALMDELNVGVMPVCDGKRLVGMVTDRDITVRCTAAGLAPDTTAVTEAMSGDVRWAWADDDVADIERTMAEVQIRRLPVVDADHNLVGIVSLGDLAGEDRSGVARTLERISTPTGPDRTGDIGSAGRDDEGTGPAQT